MIDLEQRLQPAIGYLQLGMLDEAEEEIEALPPESKTDKMVLGIRSHIYMEKKAWDLLREASGVLVKRWPNDCQHWIWLAYATRRCRSMNDAQLILEKALEFHDSEPLIHFNLACYAAQTGELMAARRKLKQAIALDPATRLLALSDPDLEALWPELEDSDSTGS